MLFYSLLFRTLHQTSFLNDLRFYLKFLCFYLPDNMTRGVKAVQSITAAMTTVTIETATRVHTTIPVVTIVGVEVVVTVRVATLVTADGTVTARADGALNTGNIKGGATDTGGGVLTVLAAVWYVQF